MAQQQINVGAAANDGTGDPMRDTFIKCNDNFDELYAADATGRDIIVPFYDAVGTTLNLTSAGNGDPVPDATEPAVGIVHFVPTNWRLSFMLLSATAVSPDVCGLSLDWSPDGSAWTSIATVLSTLNGDISTVRSTTAAVAIPGSPAQTYWRLRQVNTTGVDQTAGVRLVNLELWN